MGRPKRVTLRARWLGQQLRDLRDESGRKLDEVGEYIQRAAGTVSRFESGMYPIRRDEVAALLDFYAVGDPRRRTNLLKIADDVWQSGWWDGYSADVEDWFIDFVWLEELAVEHLLFDNTVLPGLLQTAQYAREVMVADRPFVSRDQIERGIELRMKRQELLDREEPPHVRSVIDESVLRRPVGGAEAMRPQLERLSVMAEQPHVEIRVLAFSAGVHASPSGAFKVYRMEEPYPEIAYMETLKGAVYVESPDTEPILARYDRLWESSLSSTESAEFISALIEEYS